MRFIIITFVLIVCVGSSSAKYIIYSDNDSQPLKVFLDNIFTTIGENYSCNSDLLSQPFYGKLDKIYKSKSQVINALKSILRTNHLRVYNGAGGVYIICDLDDDYYNDLVNLDTIINLNLSDSVASRLGLTSLSNGSFRFIGSRQSLNLINSLPKPIKTAIPLSANIEIIELVLDTAISSGLKITNQGLNINLGGVATFFNWSDVSNLEFNTNYSYSDVFRNSSIVYNPKFELTTIDTIDLFYGFETQIEKASFSNSNGSQTEYEFKEVGIDFEIMPYEIVNENQYKLKINIKTSDVLISSEYTKKDFSGVAVFEKNQKKLINSYKNKKVVSEIYRVPFLSSLPVVGSLFKGSKTISKIVYSFVFCEVN